MKLETLSAVWKTFLPEHCLEPSIPAGAAGMASPLTLVPRNDNLVVLGEVLEAVLLGYSFGLGLKPRVSLTKFSDHRHLLLRGDETLNLPLG